ncbi:N-acetylglucosamine kinase [Acidisoma cellulosilytica]|uniref:N-acetylglucosamine kinase n=1 Tax=Acidisoma cellulosilyticum TaxID=2802395 RepID=A0A963Z2A7_9PROT|nr:BadF/BadG/BcrA/BcrD ATPase family protein [Acidisoma cellulosilyticum]MCB8881533.1 N-acetylglucosamine kinase [Acidisoma cellulosilyticum]
MSDYVLGLDGGGTKTLLAIADRAGHVVFHARAAGIGPIENPDWAETLRTLTQSVAEYTSRIAYASFGMPSYGEMPAVSAAQEDAALAGSGFPHCVLNDVHTAFEGAFIGQPGVLLLAGTGSMVWAEDAAGKQIRVGGWGHGFGDEGSAFWIGQAAIAAFSHCLDGRGQDQAFADALAHRLGLPVENRADALTAWYYEGADPRVKVAALARDVDGLAEQGNATAKTILTQAAIHLSLHVRGAWRRLPSLPDRVWCGVGSIMNSGHVTDYLQTLLETPPISPALPPVGGALWRAATNAGWPMDSAWIDQLRTELSCQS